MADRFGSWQVRAIVTMKTSTFFASVALAAALILAGCSTPQTRINRSPEVFARLSPHEQELIQQGQVEVGFSAEAVRLALGEPDRITMRTDADGTSEVWHYITYETPDGSPLYRGWYHRYYMWHDPLYPWYLDYDGRRERERFSVIFRRGTVTALERETPR